MLGFYQMREGGGEIFLKIGSMFLQPVWKILLGYSYENIIHIFDRFLR